MEPPYACRNRAIISVEYVKIGFVLSTSRLLMTLYADLVIIESFVTCFFVVSFILQQNLKTDDFWMIDFWLR